MRRLVASSALLVGLCLPRPALANGMLGHMYTSELAISHVQTPELKQLLLDHPDEYLNGSFLPDSGYAAGDGYGEIAHWSGFVQGYLTWIQQSYSPPYDQGPAAAHVAVLLGAASHGMADESFDILLYDKSVLVDGDPKELDTGTDVWLVNDRTIDYDPPVVLDAEALSEVFANFTNHQVAPQVILDGMSKAKSAHSLVKNVLAPGHQRFREQYPWASKAYLDPSVPGSYPYNARVIANYWEQIWRRLDSNVSVDSSLVAGIDPAPSGAASERYLALDHTSIDGWITLFTGHGLEGSSLDSDSVQLLDPDGNSIPYTLRLRGDAWAHTIQLEPDADLQPKVVYRVKVTPAATTLNGEHLAEDYVAEVKTACAPGDEASCPELGASGASGAGGAAGNAGVAGNGGVAGSGGTSSTSGTSNGDPVSNADNGGCAFAPHPQTQGRPLLELLLGLVFWARSSSARRRTRSRVSG
ncbi:MAG: Ig-like domain-containing protein [Polyangiaceae bacterium]